MTALSPKFRWVACQTDFLCKLPNDAARRKALQSLPPDLHSTYSRILDRVDQANDYIRTLVQRSLRWIAFLCESLSATGLSHAISIELEDTCIDPEALVDEEEIIRWCSNLIRKSQIGDALELSHFTIKEFLLFEPHQPSSCISPRSNIRR